MLDTENIKDAYLYILKFADYVEKVQVDFDDKKIYIRLDYEVLEEGIRIGQLNNFWLTIGEQD